MSIQEANVLSHAAHAGLAWAQGIRGSLRRVRSRVHSWTGLYERALANLDGSAAAIFCYHRVLPIGEVQRLTVEPGMYVTCAAFERHLDWIAAQFHVLPLGHIVDSLNSGRPLPNRACALTFDDGWVDNYRFAFPLLRARSFPATVFLVVDRVGTEGPFWPDLVWRFLTGLGPGSRADRVRRLGLKVRSGSPHGVIAALKRMNEAERRCRLRVLDSELEHLFQERELLNWNEVQEMSQSLVTFESHGLTHTVLTQLDADQLNEELMAARNGLIRRGYGPCGLLAYPSGRHDSRVQAAAKAAGYVGAVTTSPGAAGRWSDPMCLPRLCLHEDVSNDRDSFRRTVSIGLRAVASR